MKYFGLTFGLCLIGLVCRGQSSMLNSIGFLNAREDFYTRSEQYVWSGAFYSSYGVDRRHELLYLNNFIINELWTGRVDWNGLSGVNDLLRNRSRIYWFNSNVHTPFNGSQIIIAPSQLRSQMSLTTSLSSGLYSGRFMFSSNNNDWFNLIGLRYGDRIGSPYRSISLTSVKQFKKLLIGFIGVFTTRNMNNPMTQELIELKGVDYNPNWGKHGDTFYYSKLRKQLNFNAFIEGDYSLLKWGLMLSFNERKQHKITAQNAPNIAPDYYRNFPSYAVYKNEFERAYELGKFWNSNDSGFIDFEWINSVNQQRSEAAYLLIAEIEKKLNGQFFALINYEKGFFELRLQGNKYFNFEMIEDLFGANGVRNMDYYSNLNYNIDSEELLSSGDKINFDYQLNLFNLSTTFFYENLKQSWDWRVSAKLAVDSKKRLGGFNHEDYQGKGSSKSMVSEEISIGANVNYKGIRNTIVGLYLGMDSFSKSNPFHEIRYSNEILNHLEESFFKGGIQIENSFNNLRSRLNLKLVYHDQPQQIQRFYTDDFSGYQYQFLNQEINYLSSKFISLDWFVEYPINDELMLLGALRRSSQKYLSDAQINLSNFPGQSWKAPLRNMELSSGPKSICAMGINFRSQDYYWFELSVHLLRKRLVDYDFLNLAIQENHQPEILDDINLVNLVSGKSFKSDDYFISIFISIQNILGQKYKKGGFETTRISTDENNFIPANRYWYDRGRSFFLNLKFSI